MQVSRKPTGGLSTVLLLGRLLNATRGWSWADLIAALVIAAIAAKEGIEAWSGKGCCPHASPPTRSANVSLNHYGKAVDTCCTTSRTDADDRPSPARRDSGPRPTQTAAGNRNPSPYRAPHHVGATSADGNLILCIPSQPEPKAHVSFRTPGCPNSERQDLMDRPQDPPESRHVPSGHCRAAHRHEPSTRSVDGSRYPQGKPRSSSAGTAMMSTR